MIHNITPNNFWIQENVERQSSKLLIKMDLWTSVKLTKSFPWDLWVWTYPTCFCSLGQRTRNVKLTQMAVIRFINILNLVVLATNITQKHTHKYIMSMVNFVLTINIYIYIYINNRRWQWQPTPVLLPGKSHGLRSLVGCNPWCRTESDTTEAT